MSNSLDEIFSSLLEEYEMNPNADIADLLKAQSEKEGLPDSVKDDLDKTIEMVGELHASELSLAEAKENGDSREDWLKEKIDEMTKDLDGEQRNTVVDAIDAVQNKVLEEYAKESEDLKDEEDKQ